VNPQDSTLANNSQFFPVGFCQGIALPNNNTISILLLLFLINHIRLNQVLCYVYFTGRTFYFASCYTKGVQKPIIKMGRDRKAIRVGN
jgi:hypothetical protein